MTQRDVDIAYLRLARETSEASLDPSTKCGAVIVDANGVFVAVGHNRFPNGCSNNEDIWANRELKYSRVIHAEVDAIMEAGRDARDIQGGTMYTWPPGHGPSCDRCTAHIVHAGIRRIVYGKAPGDFASRWKEACQRGLDMYQEAGVEVVPYTCEEVEAAAERRVKS